MNPKTEAEQPNIIFILSDDLGYGDLGSYGQTKIKTPSLDKIAKNGLRLTQHYAAPVCSPARGMLMTGKHQGHGFIKGNPGGIKERETLRMQDTTVAERLKKAGYTTALIGKWGLGAEGTSGYPLKKGYDHFIGYTTHVSAHTYYPDSLYRDNNLMKLSEDQYSHDLFTQEALSFIKKEHDAPFFLNLSYTIPHGPYNPPEIHSQYQDRNWPDSHKKYATMITRMDRDIGRILRALSERGIDENTLVIFTSDNGPDGPGRLYEDNTNGMIDFFRSNGPFRGMKRDVLEGGIRVPFLAYWPNFIKPGSISGKATGFQDIMPTFCELAGIEPPENIDGISMVPILFGNENKYEGHEMLYWEFIRMGGDGSLDGSRQAALNVDRNIKAVRYGTSSKIQLFDLVADPQERHDISRVYPELQKRMKIYLDTVRTPSQLWPIPSEGWNPNYAE